KVDSEVPSPVSGILKERLFEENQVVQVGEVIALIEIEGPEEESQEPTQQEEPAESSDIPVDTANESESIHNDITDVEAPALEIPDHDIPGLDQVQEKNIQIESNHQEIYSGIRFY